MIKTSKMAKTGLTTITRYPCTSVHLLPTNHNLSDIFFCIESVIFFKLFFETDLISCKTSGIPVHDFKCDIILIQSNPPNPPLRNPPPSQIRRMFSGPKCCQIHPPLPLETAVSEIRRVLGPPKIGGFGGSTVCMLYCYIIVLFRCIEL